MRLAARLYGRNEYMGVVTEAGRWCAVARVDDFYEDLALFAPLAATMQGGVSDADLKEALPVPSWSRVFCVGLNFADHIQETRLQRPEAPNIFGRWHSSLAVHGSCVEVPIGEVGLDFEGELAVVVQETPKGAKPFAFTCFNDVTARRHQHASTQWTLGKNVDSSGAIGPVLVMAEDLAGRLPGLTITTRMNGEVMQEAKLGDMLFSVTDVLAVLSEITRLRSGDVVAMGTPAGVGHTRAPERLGGPGDTFAVEITEIGVLVSHVSEKAPAPGATIQ